LPTYPFERQRYWIEAQGRPSGSDTRPGSVRKNSDIADWLYLPSWKRSAPPKSLEPEDLANQQPAWLVLSDACGLGSLIVQRLEQNGQKVIVATVGERFSKIGERRYTLNPRRRDDYDRAGAWKAGSARSAAHHRCVEQYARSDRRGAIVPGESDSIGPV
jgi:acyl transferase domain-containing protein